MAEIKNPKAFEVLLKSLNLQKNSLNNEIGKLIKKIEEKNKILAKFEMYNKEYKQQISALPPQNISTHLNHEHFMSKIAEVLINEREDAQKLKEKKLELTHQYNLVKQKIDDIQELLHKYKSEQWLQHEKKLESELSELAVSRAIHQNNED